MTEKSTKPLDNVIPAKAWDDVQDAQMPAKAGKARAGPAT